VATMIGREHVGGDNSWRAGEEFNTPFSSLKSSTSDPMPFSIVGDSGAVSITAVKVFDSVPGSANTSPERFLRAQEGQAWIVFRLAEQEGNQSRVTVAVDPSLEMLDCAELDLLERLLEGNTTSGLERSEDRVSILVKPHEIKTVAIRMKKG
jgi:hypothetical protein